MKPILVFAASLIVCLSSPVNGQHGHDHTHDPGEMIGQVNFPVSCTPAAQKQFNRAVAWLHSFEYEPAEKTFTEVTVTDPRCAMGYWGIAMSNYHPLWAPPSAAELQKAWAAIEKAKSIGGRTERERSYIAAIETFYKDYDKRDHRTRVLAYADAMEQLHAQNASDREAAVFYALSLIARGAMLNNKQYADEKKAAVLLNAVLAREPRHPGVAHYLIHSYDYPALAQLALPAARAYAKIAPASAHAQHMPSHIFTRLGLWDDAIRSNLEAKAAAKEYAAKNSMPGAWDEQLHAMDYLAYAYLQSARDADALKLLAELNQIRRVDPPNFKVAYSTTAIPARYVLERRQWADAAKLAVHPVELTGFPWERFRWADAHIHFARAIGAARLGDAAAARVEIEKLTEIKNALTEVKGDYDWAKQVEIKRQVASAWLAFVEGHKDEAVHLMRAAADLDDATDKHPVTPGTLLPAREQLGELLLELKEPAAALKEFESSLQVSPNRFNGLYGAARAARLASDLNKAKVYYDKLVAVSLGSESARPELKEAKQFMAGATAATP